jgi:RecA/RadA recombinase
MAETKFDPKNPRSWTAEQRREMFLKARATEKPDYQICSKESQEELIPYGLLTFDYVLGLKGIGRNGRVTQLHGDEGSGKSTSTYVISRNYQRLTDEPIAIFDFERTGTNEYLERIGLNMEQCQLYQPASVEECIKTTVRLLEGGVRFFVYDSIPRMKSMIPAKEIFNNKAFKANYGKHAQAMTRFYDTLLPYMAQYDAHMMMVNQTRDRIDESPEAQYAQKYPSFTNKPYSLPGGRICRFTPSVMLELKLINAYKAIDPSKATSGKGPQLDPFVMERVTPETEGKMVVNRVRVRTLKNKVTGAGYREGFIWIRPGVGIDEFMSVRELAREYGLIANSGKKWYVGKSIDEAIAGYASKEEAIEDLVVKQNRTVLGSLKELVAEFIINDTSGRHASVVTDEEGRFIAGDTDEFPATVSGGFNIDEDEE